MSDHATDDDAPPSDDPDCEHRLSPGDHVYKWTHIALYPIQVHGCVLSAGPGLVTLVDFGLTSRSPERIGPSSSEGEEEERAVAKAAGGSRRLVVVTLTEEKEIRRWKKVHYGGKLVAGGRLKRLLSSLIPGGGGGGKSEKGGSGAGGSDGGASAEATLDEESSEVGGSDGGASAEETLGQESDTLTELQDVSAMSRSAAAGKTSERDQPDDGKGGEKERKQQGQQQEPPSMPKSDPPGIVLARVRYLLEHETVENGKHHNSVLPPYHLFYANSECIAVWCMTGRFSTLQAAIFLHSTAIGQAKSAATLALFVGSQTVPVTMTVPAGGIMGWFGATTTTTTMVPLLSTQPWLIAALAGYGIAAVGTPYVLLMKARGKWEKATTKLNDGFWDWAEPDVYVEAIHGWSGLR